MTKVYVSATFRDLQECRAAVQLALRRLRVEDMAMESYVAEDRRPLERCLADVRDCDVYIGIFAWRYGFVPPGFDQSITELEYREALAGGKQCLIFLLSEDAPWPRNVVDRGADADRIEALRAELADRHMCSIFSDAADLAALVTAAVANCLADTGWPGQGLHALSPDTLKQYYIRLRQQYGVLDLDALTPAQNEEYLQIRLTSVFVEQSVREDPPPVELPRELLHRMRADGHLGTEDVPEQVDADELVHLTESYQARPVQRLFDVLGAPERRAIVLLGDPGAGKSTATRYIALALAGGHTDERLAVLADHLPLLIELRSYVTMAAEGRCQSFLDYLDHRAGTDGLGVERAALLRHLSLGGRAVVIFDGLDEVFDRRRREEVAGQIAGFTAMYPQVRVIVTSRIIGYSRRILTEVGFTHYTLQDLNEAQTADFLTSWYRLAIHDRPQDAQIRCARLLDAMRHSHAIRELAGNPLLLTILAIIGKHQPLPQERWKLYDHAATVLVEQWDVNRHLREENSSLEFLDTEDKKELLRRLAYRMQSAERGLTANYIAREELSEVFEQYLTERYQQEPATARSVAHLMINQFRERNFILSRYGPHLYGFVHRTFLEFFCADAVLAKFEHDQVITMDEITELFRRHWADLSWREVLRLLAGALHERHTARLIRLLTHEVNQPWPPEGFAPPPWNLALAVQCLAEVRNPHADVAEPAESLLRQLILLLEHCVSIDDRETAALIEEEILPSAKAIGPAWPGRQVYLSWYRRRGVRVVWSPVSAHAARLAAMLSAPAERIDDLFDEVLGELNDSPASYASVAGLAEVAQLATTVVDSPAHQAAASRARTRLVKRARADRHAGVRLAAVRALGERFGTDPQALELLVERARADLYPGVRLAAVQALEERFPGEQQVRALLVERVNADRHPGVRRAAVQALGDRYGGDDELRAVLLECLGTDHDPEVTRAATHALVERFGATREVRDLLIDCARRNVDGLARRTAVRVLGERLGTDGQVRALLIDRVQKDGDAGVLRAAGRCLVERFGPDGKLRDLLIERSRTDRDEVVRRTALRMLTDHYDQDQPLVALLTATARTDRDADVRLLSAEALADQIGVAPSVGDVLGELARQDADARVRLVAAQALVDRVGMDPAVCDVLADLARDDADPAVRLAAVRALAASLGSNPAIPVVVAERARADSDPAVRLAALRAVAAAGDPDLVPGVLDDLARTDSDDGVFGYAAATLLKITGSTGVSYQLLADRLRDGNARVRLAAVRLLVRHFGVDPPVRELLIDRVRVDPDPDLVREAAVKLAAHHGTDIEQCEVLVARATGDDATIRCVSVAILGEWFGADRHVRELLIERAGHDPDVQVRREVLRVLGERLAAHPEVRSLFVERLQDRDWSVRAATVRVLGTQFGTDRQTRTLLAELAGTDADPEFRRLAAQALTWLPGADPDHLPDVRP
ncbi:HEAT repeat domain-containing protein [Solwaraspora sp. WMMD1047]|uniref:HEAT repeat domain-containing protein n=1 Tax=Solwaraspora sp. WMMD1047 TaxID=3016102 RepID=UPI002416D6E8|nr:HEAT repeat domain-containing protein [Solwaraspora sp. WMMD1047]MDG4827873.1 HEAT repeat domain-containing protein [Solwaraspora sp. WMMD1047]